MLQLLTVETITLKNIQIAPVVRLYVDELTGQHYPYGPGFGPEEKEQFWQEQLTVVGLNGLTSVKTGSELVQPSTIPDAQLWVLLKWFLAKWYGEKWWQLLPADWAAALEEYGYPASFEGGVVLMADDQLIVSPQCCVGLQDHIEWPRELAQEDFQRIWIGHPWIYYQVAEDQVYLTGLIEREINGDRWLHYNTVDNDLLLDTSHFRVKASEQIDAQDIKYAVDRADWEFAIQGLQTRLEHFKHRMATQLLPHVPADAKKIADCLVDGNGLALSYDPESV